MRHAERPAEISKCKEWLRVRGALLHLPSGVQYPWPEEIHLYMQWGAAMTLDGCSRLAAIFVGEDFANCTLYVCMYASLKQLQCMYGN